MSLKSRVRAWVPPALWEAARRWPPGRQVRFTGDYASWEAASAHATGYDAPIILERTIAAARRVRDGQAASERDAVTADVADPNFPLAWALARSIARHGRLHVLDVGGSLGTSCVQMRRLLGDLAPFRWAVVEQPAHVEAGRREFSGDGLSFHMSVEEACARDRFDVLLLSGVLQFLPTPLAALEDLLSLAMPSVILDRTPMAASGRMRLTVQHVPPRIYPASYPAWWFSEQDLRATCARTYDLVASWPSVFDVGTGGRAVEFRGSLFERRP